MADLKKDINTLKDPSSFKNAGLASSPYFLRKVFAADPRVLRLIRAGEKVVPLIAEEIRGAKNLDEITLSAFAYIIENVKAEAAPQIFAAPFRKAVAKPGPFFVHFAAQAIRSGLRMPVKHLEPVYSQTELLETQNKLQ